MASARARPRSSDPGASANAPWVAVCDRPTRARAGTAALLGPVTRAGGGVAGTKAEDPDRGGQRPPSTLLRASRHRWWATGRPAGSDRRSRLRSGRGPGSAGQGGRTRSCLRAACGGLCGKARDRPGLNGREMFSSMVRSSRPTLSRGASTTNSALDPRPDACLPVGGSANRRFTLTPDLQLPKSRPAAPGQVPVRPSTTRWPAERAITVAGYRHTVSAGRLNFTGLSRASVRGRRSLTHFAWRCEVKIEGGRSCRRTAGSKLRITPAPPGWRDQRTTSGVGKGAATWAAEHPRRRSRGDRAPVDARRSDPGERRLDLPESWRAAARTLALAAAMARASALAGAGSPPRRRWLDTAVIALPRPAPFSSRRRLDPRRLDRNTAFGGDLGKSSFAFDCRAGARRLGSPAPGYGSRLRDQARLGQRAGLAGS